MDYGESQAQSPRDDKGAVITVGAIEKPKSLIATVLAPMEETQPTTSTAQDAVMTLIVTNPANACKKGYSNSTTLRCWCDRGNNGGFLKLCTRAPCKEANAFLPDALCCKLYQRHTTGTKDAKVIAERAGKRMCIIYDMRLNST